MSELTASDLKVYRKPGDLSRRENLLFPPGFLVRRLEVPEAANLKVGCFPSGVPRADLNISMRKSYMSSRKPESFHPILSTRGVQV